MTTAARRVKERSMATRHLEPERLGTKEREGESPRPLLTAGDLKALVDMLEGTDITSFTWDRGGERVTIRRGQAGPHPQVAPTVHAVHVPVATPPPAAAPPRAEPAPAPKAEPKKGTLVSSPFVGTFYRSPSPEAPSFVEEGTVVRKGQVLCIVEAMKLMNEIESEVAGKVVEILVQNGAPVEFGEALFRIEPA
jgi:acetyl-CoA carboxylase biotin carboxyl carrier protein